ncbi:MAG: hypothetical protein LQ343_002241 [Gyalolechia ehrenbergii]|nr:MAG: hypothetical protein LQ343_002241 [Gyalolechia ehrenbergii]
MATPTRPQVGRLSSRVPGGFDTDEDLSPIKTEFDHEDFDEYNEDTPSKPPQHAHVQSFLGDDSSINAVTDEARLNIADEGNTIDEKEIRQKLMDMDSSFFPTASPAARTQTPGVDDTYVFGDGKAIPKGRTSQAHVDESAPDVGPEASPQTPPEMYQTPAPGREYVSQRHADEETNDPGHYNTSSLETMSSSPTAAAAARTVSRAVSSASTGGYETADDTHDSGVPIDYDAGAPPTDEEATPRKTKEVCASTSRDNSLTPRKPAAEEENESVESYDTNDSRVKPHEARKRPIYLKSRMASQGSSHSSYTTNSTEGGSEATVGADYALQSGGSVPFGGSLNSRPSLISRSVTLGSMASAITDSSDGDDNFKPSGDALDGLDTLDEGDEPSIRNVMKENRQTDETPHTPQGNHATLHTPTETVIAKHVKDVQVPATMAREFQDRFRPSSPEKRNGGPTPLVNRHGKSMTLKEQSNTIDKYMKLNWDLQLKITFLNQALNQRSDEGVKAMISENVELNTVRVNLAKEIRELKRSIRTLERDLEKKNEDLVKMTKVARETEARAGPGSQELQDMENEISYLRERVSTYEVDFEKVRHDSIRQESEKRRMAEILKSVSRRGGSDIGIREELDYFRDELEAETARREEADEENRRLREEIWRLQADTRSTTEQRFSKNRRPGSSGISQSGRSERGFDLNGTASAASSTLVEQLRHENAKLQRDMRAQESMLTSRNKEKEHLYQEIEELKLSSRRGDGTRSVAGDSIFERSVSRAHRRAASRTSEAPPAVTQMNDAERESYETKNGELRDEISALKLEIQDMTRQLEMCLDELGQYDRLKAEHEKLQQAYDNELGVATEDLQSLQAERDEALQIQEQLDAELEEQRNEFEDVQAGLHNRIIELEAKLEYREGEMQRMENEMANQTEQAEALRTEVRNLSERLVGITGEMKVRARRIEELEIEVEAMNNETDAIHKDRSQLRNQHERLAVQYESGQSQIAFLREEQDGDKIKIGDLENSLSDIQTKLDSETERAKELEKRLAEERHQREVVGSKEKQEVQKMVNDLNREAADAKDESRQLKATLQSTEIELTTWKELESHLRETLGEPNGTRSTFLTSITRLQKELESTLTDLDNTRNTLAETEGLLRDRNSILESNGLEFKKLADVLDRERQGRRQDKTQYEQWQKTHQHISRTVSQKDMRISELESAKQSDRRKLQALESQLRDQLHERNNLLLTLWSRLSATCGPDWQHQNSLINGRVATLEVISSMLPAFSKTLLLAVQHIEGIMVTFKTRVKTMDRDLQNQYRALEDALDERTKKLEKLENTVQSNRIQGTFTAAPEIAKLRGENRLLKSEIAVLQNKDMHARSTAHRSSSSRDLTPLGSNNNNTSAPPPSLARHYSSSAVEHSTPHRTSPGRTSSLVPLPIPERSAPASLEPNQSRWTHRLRELERRLKAEREARLLDRTGARKRLEEGMKENEELRAELERERERRKSGR